MLLLTRVDKPALLRRLFELASLYSGRILSFQKMLGQLQDAGSTVTLSHYLDLLTAGGMVTGLPKYAGETVRQRGSSPKFQVFTTALMTAQAGLTPGEVLADPEWRGHLVESAVGAHLLAAQSAGECRVFYWLDRNRELDFVVERGRRLTAIEVKGGRKKGSLPGLAAFTAAFKPDRSLLVGGDGIAVGDFLSLPVTDWIA